MRTRKASVIFAIFAVLISAGIGVSAAARQDATQEIGPVYPLEGASKPRTYTACAAAVIPPRKTRSTPTDA